MTTTIETRRKHRWLMLKKFYELAGGKAESRAIDIGEVGRLLGWEREQTDTIYDYLQGERLLKLKTLEGGATITRAGIKEVEDAERNPRQPTPHFPASIAYTNVIRPPENSSTLKRFRETCQHWGLTGNPFHPIPPTDPQELIRVFHGRDREIERALPALYDGRNILVRGSRGIGKTALTYTILDRLSREVIELDERMLVLYINGSTIETPADFYRLLLLAITNQMANTEGLDRETRADADSISNHLIGGVVRPHRQSVFNARVHLAFFSFGWRDNSASPQGFLDGDRNLYPLLLHWLELAQEHFSGSVFAIDDLDKQDSPIVQDIVESNLDLFRNRDRRAFLMTGRGFTDLQEASLKSLGIFAEDLRLEPMLPDDLRQMTVKYLNTVRRSPRDDTYPFSDEAMARLAEYAQGNPRQLNAIAEKILRLAASQQCDAIDLETFESLLPQIQEDVTQKLTPQMRKLLYIAYQADGIGENITNEQLDRLGALTFSELIPMLRTLEQQELLLRDEDESGLRYRPSKLFLPPSPEDSPPET